jgi:uncharacterized membrane protein YgcG
VDLAEAEVAVLEEGALVDHGKMLSTSEKKALHQLILKTEAEMAAEIHVAFYKTATDPDVLQVAKKYFIQHKLDQNTHHNTVLIYILEQDRRFAIIGSEDVHKKVPDNYWHGLSASLGEQFKHGQFYQGLVDCIVQLKNDIQHHYPKV